MGGGGYMQNSLKSAHNGLEFLKQTVKDKLTVHLLEQGTDNKLS